MSTRWIVGFVAVGVWLSGASVSAADGGPALHWSRAENAADCVDPRTLAELVETYTGPVLVAPGSADLSIEGEIERSAPEEFRLRVGVTVTRGRPAGQRLLTLNAADCRKLDAAIAFVIATTISPDLGSGALPAELSWLEPTELAPGDQLREELASSAASDARPNPQPSAAVKAPPGAQSEPRTDEESTGQSIIDRWELGIAATAGTGVVPKANAGGLITAARTFGSMFALTMQLRGNASLGSFEVIGDHTVGVETFGGALLGCGRIGNARAFGLQACLGPEVGWFVARGSGFSAAHTVVQPVYGGLFKLELKYEIADKLAITAAGLFALGFRRPAVWYNDALNERLLFRSELYSIQGALGLRRSF